MQKVKKILENDVSEIPLGLLISITHRMHMVYLNGEMKDYDITAGQFPFLIGLYHKEGVTQDDMATHFHMDKGTVARALKKLEDNEFICRKIDPENRRRYLLYLTLKGKQIIPKIKSIDQEWEKSINANFSQVEKQNLTNIMQKMALISLEKAQKNGDNNK
jgi:DNA-binding MarR family transcriptional regulator